MLKFSSQKTSPISRFLNERYLNELNQIGYNFKENLGQGTFGVVFRCDWKYVNNENKVIVKRLAAKIIEIKYVPEFRDRNNLDLAEYTDLKITYRVLGKQIEENIKWCKVSGVSDRNIAEESQTIQSEFKARKRLKNIENEAQSMCKTNHRNVVKLENMIRFCGEYSTGAHVVNAVIFMELADQDLSQYLGNTAHTEQHTKELIAQISRGVAHLHSRGIAHMDLKPSNILVFKERRKNIILKITDFGSVILFDTNVGAIGSDRRGTQLYRCPHVQKQWREVVSGERNQMSYDATKVDVWSLAVILLVIMFGNQVINNVFLCKSPHKSLSDEYLQFFRDRPHPHSPLLDQLLESLFIEQQEDRINITQFCEHQWIIAEINENRRSNPSFND